MIYTESGEKVLESNPNELGIYFQTSLNFHKSVVRYITRINASTYVSVDIKICLTLNIIFHQIDKGLPQDSLFPFYRRMMIKLRTIMSI